MRARGVWWCGVVVRCVAVYFVKTDRIRDQLKFNDLLSGDILSGELNEAGLQNLALISHQVYFPLLSNPANRSGWSGPTSKEVMLKFSAFLSTLTMTVGQAKGETLLPAPPPEAFDDELDAKERAHLLETSVIDWIKQIQVRTARHGTARRRTSFYRTRPRPAHRLTRSSLSLCF